MTTEEERTWARQRLYDSYVTSNKGLPALGDRQAPRESPRNHRYFAGELRVWLGDLPRSVRVLDVGCGSGFLLDVMESLGFRRTFGIDISSEQVALARVRHPGVEQGDVFEFLSRQTEKFDVVLAFDIVEHFTVAEALRFLDALHRVMPPGGLLVIQTPNGDAPLCGPVFNGDLTHETLFTPHSLRHLLGAADFELISFREHAPRPRDLRSTVRWVLWQGVRQVYRLLHLAEAGSSPSPIYTRVFRTLARRR